MLMIRPFTNSLEAMCNTVAIYHFFDQKKEFTRSTAIMTAVISISFMIRTTSPVGWVPLLAWKVLFEGSLPAFLLAGIFVALPVCCACVAADTYYYKSDTWVVTAFNFYSANIAMGLSKFFGIHSPYMYWKMVLPENLHLLTPWVIYGVTQSFADGWFKKVPPYLAMCVSFYFIFFSAVGHKEDRFMLPIW